MGIIFNSFLYKGSGLCGICGRRLWSSVGMIKEKKVLNNRRPFMYCYLFSFFFLNFKNVYIVSTVFYFIDYFAKHSNIEIILIHDAAQ